MSTQTIDKLDLAKALRLARKQAHMTQEEAASLIGAKRTTMVAIEQGQREVSAEEMVKLSQGYRVDVLSLLGVTEEREIEAVLSPSQTKKRVMRRLLQMKPDSTVMCALALLPKKDVEGLACALLHLIVEREIQETG